jgi:DNA-binding LacI/PurR family transcriptional regulator
LLADPPRGVLVAHAVGENAWGWPVLQRLHEAGVPLVVNGDAPELARYDRVVPDHEKGAFDLTQWLVGRGRKKILRVNTVGDNDYWIKARNAGHVRAMRSAKAKPLDPLMVKGYSMPPVVGRDDFDAMVRLFVGYLVEHIKRVDALMAVTDPEVYSLAAACRLLGVKPNLDVDLVGYDNMIGIGQEERFEKTGPAATVDKRNDVAGQRMVSLLLDRIEGRLPRKPQRVLVEPELRVF